jgi:hypothetical protein
MKQSEAMRLANELDAYHTAPHHKQAAAELRRLSGALAAQPAPVQEPLEYWNAVEGWVKIDEVREHFKSVGCGTIYKTAGDGRVPLTAAQRQWVELTDEETDTEATQHEQSHGFIQGVQWANTKLKEKNNG